jgi:hypothetical protein
MGGSVSERWAVFMVVLDEVVDEVVFAGSPHHY